MCGILAQPFVQLSDWPVIRVSGYEQSCFDPSSRSIFNRTYSRTTIDRCLPHHTFSVILSRPSVLMQEQISNSARESIFRDASTANAF